MITTGRVLLAVVAVGALFYMQRRGQRKSEEYFKRLQEKQRREAQAPIDPTGNDNEDLP